MKEYPGSFPQLVPLIPDLACQPLVIITFQYFNRKKRILSMWWTELMNILCLLQTQSLKKSEVYMMKEYVEVSNKKEINAKADQL